MLPIERRLVPIPDTNPQRHRYAYFQGERELPRWLGKLRHVISGVHEDGYDEYNMLSDAFKMLCFMQRALSIQLRLAETGLGYDSLTDEERAFLAHFQQLSTSKQNWPMAQYQIDPTAMDRVFDRQEKVSQVMANLLK